ncbi:MAG TPA: response regulator transcription factor [Acidimicrobiales bacterium]|nr:response regulator transcription factor [Acidimicrobiales bacterium]
MAGSAMNGAGGHVLVVTEDDFLADGVCQVLGTAGFGVTRRRRGPIESLLIDERPALLVMDTGDIDLMDRKVVVSRVRQASDVPLVVITRSSRLEDRLAGLEAGADEVLATPFPLTELRWKVTAILRRAGQIASSMRLGDLLVDEPAHVVERNGRLIDLTALEFSLLVALCRNRGQVLSKSQLLSMVWGFDHHDVNLVEVHVSALRRKLERSGPRVIHTVRGVGYVLRPAEAAIRPSPFAAERAYTWDGPGQRVRRTA